MVNPKSPQDQELESNEIVKEIFLEAINQNIAFGFVGAGCSKKLDYMSWDELVQIALVEAIKKKDPGVDLDIYSYKKDDLLWYAEILKSYLSNVEFYAIINNNYGPKRKMDHLFFQNLIKIPFRHFITTNYDIILEHTSNRLRERVESFSWDEKDKLRNFYQSINNSSDQAVRYIFHIHGIYNKPDSIILTEKDYMKLYFEEELANKILWSIISSFRMCFIGFSMKDLDLLSIFRKSRWDFGRGDPRHFAIMGAETIPKRITTRIYMKDKYGIMPIFYNTKKEEGEKHKEQEDMIEELAKRCMTGTESSTEDATAIERSLSKDAEKLDEIGHIE